MSLSWLPYVGGFGSGKTGTVLSQPRFASQPSRAAVRRLPLLTRPPAISLRPAVAVPFGLASALLATVAWASHVPPQAALPPDVAVAVPREAALPGLPGPVQRWGPQIVRWSSEFGLPVDLVAVVMTLESCGDPEAHSSAGAQGLFQVMPFHFAADEDQLDPDVNARRGLAYLRRGLELAAGDVGLGLAGYNGGHGLIQRDPVLWPAETVRYVRWGAGILDDLRAGVNPSPTLQSWLDAGGARLCRRAEARSG